MHMTHYPVIATILKGIGSVDVLSCTVEEEKYLLCVVAIFYVENFSNI